MTTAEREELAYNILLEECGQRNALLCECDAS